MLIRNKILLFRLMLLKSKVFLLSNWKKIFRIISLSLILIVGGRIYCYYNRLEYISKYEYKEDIFELYQDWSKSTKYHAKYSERYDYDNYYVVKKNGNVYFRYKHDFPFAVSYRAFFFYSIELDSLVLLQQGITGKYGSVFLKIPINKNIITKKDVRIIPIYPGILKDGSQIKVGERVNYLLDDFKKVPREVINYENIINDY